MKLIVIGILAVLLPVFASANDVAKTLDAFRRMEPIANNIQEGIYFVKLNIEANDVRRACMWIGKLDPHIGAYSSANLRSSILMLNYLEQSPSVVSRELLKQVENAANASRSLLKDLGSLDNVCSDGVQVNVASVLLVIKDAQEAYAEFARALAAVERMH